MFRHSKCRRSASIHQSPQKPTALLSAIAFAVALNPTSPSHAQESAIMENILVTATRREESLQDIPAAISAVSGDQFEFQQINDLRDLGFVVPNVQITGSLDQTFINIRGSFTGSADGPAIDQAVAVYVDDIYTIGPSDMPVNFFDVERVEVLRGPQGTLFGRNATGGVLAIHTPDPSFETELGFLARAGNFDLTEYSGFISGPIIDDRLAGRVSMNLEQRDGFYENTNTGNTNGDQDNFEARGSLLFLPNDQVDIEVGLSYADSDNGGPSVASLTSGLPVNYPDFRSDPDYTNAALDTISERETFGGFVNLNWELGDHTLTSITGYRDLELEQNQVSFMDPLPIFAISIEETGELFTQELRLASSAEDRLSWITGVYFINTDRDRREGVASPVLGPGFQQQTVELTGWSVFGEALYRFNDQWSLTLGGRYSYEDKDGETSKAGLIFTGGPEVSGSFGDTYDAFTPKVTLTYAPTEDALFYGTISRGFKGGGFDFGGDTPESLIVGFEPEFVTNYELGTRSMWLDQRLTLNAALFRQDFTDQQVRVPPEPPQINFVPSNVGESFSQGLELELSYATDVWNLGLAYTLQEFEITEGPFDGNEMPLTPESSLTLFAGAYWNLPNNLGHVRVQANVAFRSEIWSDINNSDTPLFRDATEIDGLVNASAEWTLPNDQWAVSIWGRNITDERAVTSGFNWTEFTSLGGYDGIGEAYFATYTAPATYGVTVSFRK